MHTIAQLTYIPLATHNPTELVQDLLEHLAQYEVKIEVAYEVGTGNAFKKYSPHDFKLGKDGVNVAATHGKVRVLSAKHNTMELQVNQVPFQVQVNGFDSNRDLKVKVR